MSENTFLFTADVHMKRRTWTNSTLLQGDATAAFSKVCRDCSVMAAGGIIIGGDLFDSNRPTSQDLIDTIDIIKGNFNHCYYISGNHDSVQPAYLEAFRDCSDMPELELVDLDSQTHPQYYTGAYRYTLAGVRWLASASELYQRIKEIVDNWKEWRTEEDKLYIVLHNTFQHLLGFDGAYDLTIDMIKDLCGEEKIYFLVGHIHTRDTTVYNSAGAYIHSPGSLYPLSADKMGEPCFGSMIDLNNSQIQDIPSNVRRYETININDIPADNIIEALDTAGLKPEHVWSLPTFIRLVVPENYDQPILIPETKDYVFKIDRQLAHTEAAVARQSSYSIQQAIKDELADSANRDMAMDMAEEILASDDPMATIEKWFEFWQVKKVTPC